MQLQLSFSLLLGSIICALLPSADAIPYSHGARLVSVPLAVAHTRRNDLPAAVYLQQHINHAQKRYSRAAGVAPPSAEAQAAAIQRRIDALPAHDRAALARRFSRVGTNPKTPTLAARYNRPAAFDTNVANAALAGAKIAAAIGNRSAAANPNANGFSPEAAAAQRANGVIKSNTPTAKDSMALDVDANDVGYVSTIQIGTPPRDFRVIMDSGSADLWVAAEGCQMGSQGITFGSTCGKHTSLGASTSSSFKDMEVAFEDIYGSGYISGTMVTDNLSIAGLNLPGHHFGIAQVQSQQFASDENIDGLMGLAKSTLSNQKVLNPPESMAKAGLIQEAITSYRIPRAADGLKDGQVTFGGIDPATIDKATLVTVDNVSKVGFWEAAMTISINGKDSGLQGRTAILDTGTTLILAPNADVAALHEAIKGARYDPRFGYVVPCTTSASVAMTFGSQTFTIDPRDITFSPINSQDPKGDCMSGIQPGQVGTANQWLVGDVFLKNVVFSHNSDKNAISLAKPSGSASTGVAVNPSASASESATATATAPVSESVTASTTASATASATDSASATETASVSDSASADKTATATNNIFPDETAAATDSASPDGPATVTAPSDSASTTATALASDNTSSVTSATASESASGTAAGAKSTCKAKKAKVVNA